MYLKLLPAVWLDNCMKEIICKEEIHLGHFTSPGDHRQYGGLLMFIIILFVTPRLIMYTRAELCSPGDCQGQTVTFSPPASDAAEQRLGDTWLETLNRSRRFLCEYLRFCWCAEGAREDMWVTMYRLASRSQQPGESSWWSAHSVLSFALAPCVVAGNVSHISALDYWCGEETHNSLHVNVSLFE